MNVRPLLLLGLTSLLACRERPARQTTDAPADTTASTTSPPVAAARCYGYTQGESRVALRLDPAEGNSVRGNLTYELAGKDRNTGTLAGEMRGDTLWARYTFQSEGRESVREVVFLTQADGLHEGVGPVAERDGAMVFTDRGALKFDQMPVLTKVECAH